MKMIWFDDRPLLFKVSLAPGLGLLCVVLLGVVAFGILSRLDSHFETLDREAFTQYERAAALQVEVLGLYAELHRVTTLAAGGAGANLSNEASLLSARAQKLAAPERLAGMANDLRGPLEAYAGAAKDTIGMLAVDSSMAAILMSNTEFTFAGLSSVLAEATGKADARRQAIFAEAAGDSGAAIVLFGAIVAIFLVGGVGVTVLLSRAITQPTAAVTQAMRRLAQGDMSVQLALADRRDEIGAMVAAVRAFRESLMRAEEMRRDQEERQRHELARAEHVRRLSEEFEARINQTVQDVASALDVLRGTAAGVNEVAAQAAEKSAAVTNSANTASDSAQAVASGAEQLSASVQAINANIAESRRISATAMATADRSAELISGLANAIGEIGQIVSLIDVVAGKTNLLALNATIEAARAGEAGKGFAVVAHEVKGLADRTAQATAEISGQIEAIRNASGEAVDAVHAITDVIADMTRVGDTIAEAVGQQADATSEIAKAAAVASRCNSQAAEDTADVSSATEDTGRAAQLVLATVETMTRSADDLRNAIDGFLRAVRAA